MSGSARRRQLHAFSPLPPPCHPATLLLPLLCSSVQPDRRVQPSIARQLQAPNKSVTAGADAGDAPSETPLPSLCMSFELTSRPVCVSVRCGWEENAANAKGKAQREQLKSHQGTNQRKARARVKRSREGGARTLRTTRGRGADEAAACGHLRLRSQASTTQRGRKRVEIRSKKKRQQIHQVD